MVKLADYPSVDQYLLVSQQRFNLVTGLILEFNNKKVHQQRLFRNRNSTDFLFFGHKTPGFVHILYFDAKIEIFTLLEGVKNR
jgi:hypothetical protein